MTWKNSQLRAVAAVALPLLLAGCAHYEFADAPFGGARNIAVSSVDNRTDEPRLSSYLRHELGAALSRDGLRLSSEDDADCVLNTRVVSYRLRNIGEVDTSSSDHDLAINRTVVFGVEVTVEYNVVSGDSGSYLSPPQRVVGRAEFSELVDFDTVRRDGLRQAAYDAALQIASLTTTP